MTLIGNIGIVEFTRSFPDPVVLPPSALDVANNRFAIVSDAYWPGDAVTLVHSGGTRTGFVWRDTLDRITLHTTAAGAQDNTVGTRVSLSGLSGATILCVTGAAGATTVLTSLYGSLGTVTQETSLQAYITPYANYTAANNSTALWGFQGLLQKYNLKLGGEFIETGSVGERFGDPIKAAITGSGTFDYLVNFVENSNSAHDIDIVLRMALMIENQAKGKARFYLKQRTAPRTVTVSGNQIVFLPGAVYYSADIVLLETSMDCSADDFIKGSANFATAGRVRLLRE
jgi:hypothetical protein